MKREARKNGSMQSAYLPQVVIGVDPDATRTALAVCVRRQGSALYSVAHVDGGGSGREAVPWGDVLGATVVVRHWLAQAGVLAGEARRAGEYVASDAPLLVVGVEAQIVGGGAHTADVEGCRRARWHWDAACLTLAVRCSHVDPGAWQSDP
jgi:hypothetical protein